MKKLKYLIPGTIAVIASIFVSIILIEDTIIFLSCLAIGPIALLIAIMQCIYAKHSCLKALVSTLIPAILFIAIVCSHIPLRLTFRVYRAEFDIVASQIEAGTPPETPFWIGPFHIKMAGCRNNTGIPYIATNNEAFEINGFVKHPDGYGFNLWSCISLDDSWSYIAED